MAEEIRLEVVTTANSQGLHVAARDIKGLRGEADKLGKSFNAAEGETYDLEAALEQARLEFKRLNAEFAKTGDKSLFGDIKSQGSIVGQLEKIRREIAEEGDGIGVTLGSAIGTQAGRRAGGGIASGIADSLTGARFKYQAIGALVAVGVAAAPTLGAMVAGAVTGLVGVGGIAGGIFAASKDPGVRAAASSFGQTVSSMFFNSGDSFAEPIVDALAILQQGFSDLNLVETFRRLAPYVNDIANGVAGFGRNLMAGVNNSLDRIGPALEILGQELPRVGAAFGYMIQTMAESEGMLEGLRFLFGFLEANIKGVGNIVGFLSDQFHNMNQAIASFSGAMEDIPGFVLAEQFSRLNNDVETFIDNQRIGAQVQAEYTKRMRETAGAVQATTDAINVMNQAMFAEQGNHLSAAEAATAYAASLLEMKKSVREHGTSLSSNTEQGLANQRMLQGIVRDAMAVREANLAAGMGTDEANRKYQQQIVDLQKLAEKLGFDKRQIELLIGAYKQIPSRITTTIIQDYQTRGKPAGEHSGLRIAETRESERRGFSSGGVTPAFGAFRVHAGETLWSDRQHFVATKAETEGLGGVGGNGFSGAVEIRGDGVVRAMIAAISREVDRQGGRLAILGLRG